MIATQIWRDDDFVALSPGAQRLYMLLLTRPNISACGLLPLQTRRWASLSAGTTEQDVRVALDELTEGRFVVIDYVTEELLVRTFAKWDGGANNATRRQAIVRAAEVVESRVIGWALKVEFEKLDLPTDGLPDTPPYDPSDGPSDDPTDGPSHDHGVVVQETCRGNNPQPADPQPASRSTTAIELAEPPRIDVERICQHLADRIEGNGAKRPTITAKWRDAARLMLDRDGRTEQQVHDAIDWAQNDEFWRSNVLSLPKLREKYDQLQLQALRRSKPQVSRRQQETNDWYERAMARAQAKEAGQ